MKAIQPHEMFTPPEMMVAIGMCAVTAVAAISLWQENERLRSNERYNLAAIERAAGDLLLCQQKGGNNVLR
jgi:protein-S-isoprenylcysteine O-methyltransferase Ste14